jgi:hypothetical protein
VFGSESRVRLMLYEASSLEPTSSGMVKAQLVMLLGTAAILSFC